MEECYWNFTESNTPPLLFFTFFRLYKWHQIAQSITFRNAEHEWKELRKIMDYENCKLLCKIILVWSNSTFVAATFKGTSSICNTYGSFDDNLIVIAFFLCVFFFLRAKVFSCFSPTSMLTLLSFFKKNTVESMRISGCRQNRKLFSQFFVVGTSSPLFLLFSPLSLVLWIFFFSGIT